ncbi:MAG: hypothetical protein B6I28_02055 [Fusobacteriia bacterium 4572_132]|nr:MAG: hypothetical protein B6I28_02055 [Fusobacteriia bacterium 4572_132]
MIKSIFKEIEKNGGKAYVVGGYVRDMILGQKSKDVDIEVFNIPPEKLEDILKKYGKTSKVGRAYEIYILKGYEFSLPREKNINGKLKINPYISLKEACKRRDLKMNSMLYDILNDEIIDIYNGERDIKNKMISYVSKENFRLDPLRVLRVAQFKARFEFEVEEKTEKLCQELVLNLKEISKERIFIELEKILMKARKPSIAFRWMEKIGLLEVIFPEIANLRKIEQGEKYHPEGDVLEHTFLVLDVLELEERNIELMIALLYHDIGKALIKTVKEGNQIHFYGHAEAGSKVIRKYLHRMTTNKELIKKVETLVKYHMRPLAMINNITKKAVRRLGAKVDIIELMKMHKADMLGKGGEKQKLTHIDKILKIYLEIKDEIKPLIKGSDLIELGYKPSKEFGNLLKKIYEAQLDEKFLTKKEGLKYIISNLNQKIIELN